MANDDTLTGLLRSIILNPDENTPRLMYADALDERDNRVPAGSGLTDDKVLASRIRSSIQETWEPQRIDYTSRWWPLPNGAVGWYVRGFYESIECPAEAFLAHADELIWHEGQTCDGCYVGGATSLPDGYTVKIEHQVWGSYSRTEDYPKQPLCRLCRGSRKRPCPPTAQPIRKVELMTEPVEIEEEFGDFRCLLVAETGLQVWRHPKWPGIEFDLSSRHYYGFD